MPKTNQNHFLLNRAGEHVSEAPVLRDRGRKQMQDGKNNATLNQLPPAFSPALGRNWSKIILTWNFGPLIDMLRWKMNAKKLSPLFVLMLLALLACDFQGCNPAAHTDDLHVTSVNVNPKSGPGNFTVTVKIEAQWVNVGHSLVCYLLTAGQKQTIIKQHLNVGVAYLYTSTRSFSFSYKVPGAYSLFCSVTPNNGGFQPLSDSFTVTTATSAAP
jgi:hypothetical protein